MTLLILLRLSIAAIALFVTYASVQGLGALFSSIAVPVMIAGTALEAGKYVAVSYAYQYWGQLRKLEACLVVFFTTLLMIFTSAGVFAYLGQGYQSSFKELQQKRIQLSQLETQQSLIADRLAGIDRQIADLPGNLVNGRIRLIREYEKEKQPLITQRDALDKDILAAKTSINDAEVHAGPITYIASVFAVPVATAATWVILALTLCLDPFALFLSLLLNKLTALRKQSQSLQATAAVQAPVQADNKPALVADTAAVSTDTVDVAHSSLDTVLPQSTKDVSSDAPALTTAKTHTVDIPMPLHQQADREATGPPVIVDAVSKLSAATTALPTHSGTPVMDTVVPLLSSTAEGVESTSVVIQRGGQIRR